MNELANLEVMPQETPPVEPQAPAPEAPPPAPPVDEPPSPDALKSDVEKLAAQRKELEERNKKLEADARYWREQKSRERAEYFKGRGEQPTPPPEVPGIGKVPVPGDFADYDQYVEAKVKHEVTSAKVQWDAESARKAQDQEVKKRDQELQTKLSAGFAKHEDFGEKVLEDRTLPITMVMKETLHELENPAEVLYYLTSNRAEAIKIANSSPARVAILMSEIDARLKANAVSTPPSTTTKTTTKAPPPITPVKSNETIVRDPDKMTQKEYNEWSKSQGLKPF